MAIGGRPARVLVGLGSVMDLAVPRRKPGPVDRPVVGVRPFTEFRRPASAQVAPRRPSQVRAVVPHSETVHIGGLAELEARLVADVGVVTVTGHLGVPAGLVAPTHPVTPQTRLVHDVLVLVAVEKDRLPRRPGLEVVPWVVTRQPLELGAVVPQGSETVVGQAMTVKV